MPIFRKNEKDAACVARTYLLCNAIERLGVNSKPNLSVHVMFFFADDDRFLFLIFLVTVRESNLCSAFAALLCCDLR